MVTMVIVVTEQEEQQDDHICHQLHMWRKNENLGVFTGQIPQPGAKLSSYPRHPLLSFSVIVMSFDKDNVDHADLLG